MALLPISEEVAQAGCVQFRELDGTRISGAREWEPLLLEIVAATASWEGVTVRAAGRLLPVALRKIAGEACIIAEWPRSGPGAYRVEVHAAATRVDEVFTIRPSKMSTGDFADLLTSLETELPVSVAIALQNAGGLAGLDLTLVRPASLAEEVARVRRAVHGDGNIRGIAQLLVELAKSPHAILRSEERWARREHSRRPALSRIAQAYARKGNLAQDDTPLQLVDSRVHESFDVYENRIVATFVKQVDRHLRRLENIAAFLPGSLLADARRLRTTLTRARRAAPFLNEVAELRSAPTRVTMVLLRRSEYRATFAGYLAFQRGLAIRIEDPGLTTPLAELPHLYQTWGTLQVILSLLTVAGNHGFRVVSERLVGRDTGGLFLRVLPDGREAVVLKHPANGRTVRLIPERSYSAGGMNAGRLHSVTFSQRPDVAIEVLDPDGTTAIYLFDPKYKLADSSTGSAGQPTKPDIDKMHAYRDAIRDSTDRRIVKYAAILYPGATVAFGHGVDALSALPSTRVELASHLQNVIAQAIS